MDLFGWIIVAVAILVVLAILVAVVRHRRRRGHVLASDARGSSRQGSTR
jgi:hypothetical protein